MNFEEKLIQNSRTNAESGELAHQLLRRLELMPLVNGFGLSPVGGEVPRIQSSQDRGHRQ